MASRVRTGRPSTRSSVPAGGGAPAAAALSGGSIGALSFQIQFAVGNFGMDVEAAIHGMDPDTIAIAWNGDLRGLIDDDEVFVRQVRQELTDVQVDMALRAPLGGVERNAPRVVGPFLPSLGDGGGPEASALLERHLEELLGMAPMKARQREPAMGLVGVGIAQKEVRHIGGLLFSFLAEPALAGFEGFRDGDIAEAGAHVGARERQQAESDYGEASGNAHRCTDYSE